MATQINITPILKGKPSEQFNQTLEGNKGKKVSDERKREMKTLVDKVLSKK